jgi:2-dehydropantoate 2-reductase
LLKNLANALEALLGDTAAHHGDAVADIRRAALHEGETVLAAAGIAYNSDDERRALQGNRMEFHDIPGAVRGGGSTWQSLTRGASSVEADYLNGEIALLGRLHGVATPVNVLLQRLVTDAARERRAPGDLPQEQLHALLDVAPARN